MIINVLTEASNGNGDAVGFNAAQYTDGSPTTLVFYGTWDSATAKLQISPDSGTTWIDIEDATATADSAFNITASEGFAYRGVVSGGGGSESITCKWGQ